MGRLAPEKGFDVLLKAFALFSEKHSDYTLTVFGEGKLHKDLEELAESLGVSQKVSFPGADKAACEKCPAAGCLCFLHVLRECPMY